MTKTLAKGTWYTVTTASTCTITDANGTSLGTAEAGKQFLFQATTEQITFSDDSATVLVNPKLAPVAAGNSSGGGVTAEAVQAVVPIAWSHWYEAPYASGSGGVPSVAVGDSSKASGLGSTALGISAVASGQSAVAVGGTASGYDSIALGNSATASGGYSIAIGYNAAAHGVEAVALGKSAITQGDYSIALGDRASGRGDQSIAIGCQAYASEVSSTAIGYYVEASGRSSTALGCKAIAACPHSTAIGEGAETSEASTLLLNAEDESGAQFFITIKAGKATGGDDYLDTEDAFVSGACLELKVRDKLSGCYQKVTFDAGALFRFLFRNGASMELGYEIDDYSY